MVHDMVVNHIVYSVIKEFKKLNQHIVVHFSQELFSNSCFFDM